MKLNGVAFQRDAVPYAKVVTISYLRLFWNKYSHFKDIFLKTKLLPKILSPCLPPHALRIKRRTFLK